VKYVANKLDISAREVIRRYNYFQVATRQKTKDELNPNLLSRRGSELPGYAIFLEWRSGYWQSSTGFSNAFCVHPELVRNYEEGISPELPEPVASALREVGLLDPNWSESCKNKNDMNENDILNPGSGVRAIETLSRHVRA